MNVFQIFPKVIEKKLFYIIILFQIKILSFSFSKVIDTIAHAIAGVEGVALLDIDPGLSTNRTIYSKITINISHSIKFHFRFCQ